MKVTIGEHWYELSDEPLKVGDWYINLFVSERHRSPQTHTHIRHIINHKKDYRFKYCKKIVATNNSEINL